jgi:hypothetical protein
VSQPFGRWGHFDVVASPAVEPRRLAGLRVAPEFLLGFLQDLGRRRITVAGIPDDAQVVSADYEPLGRCFLLTLESKEFEPMPLGAHLPLIDVSLTDHGPWPLEVPDSA